MRHGDQPQIRGGRLPLDEQGELAPHQFRDALVPAVFARHVGSKPGQMLRATSMRSNTSI